MNIDSGDRFGPLDEFSTRFLFGNINGLQLRDKGTRLQQVFREIHGLQADHTGLVEINTNMHHFEANQLLYKTAREEFTHSVLTSATSQTPCDSLFKPGGVLSVTRDNLVGRLIDKGSDSMGRWTFCKYAGKNGKVITVVTVYQVCMRPTNVVGNTAFHQQQLSIATEAQDNDVELTHGPQPRIRFHNDLVNFLRRLRRKGESIVLMGDFNDDICSGSSPMQRLFQDRDLQFVDIIGRCHPHTQSLSTYIRGTKRLDFILITQDLVPAVRHCGYLPFHSHFRTDHRFAFIDFQTATLFGNLHTKLAPNSLRDFTSKDPKQVQKYLLEKYRLLQDRNFFSRMNRLDDLPIDDPDHYLAEQLDKCWVECSLLAANRCKARRREWWSIPLHQAIEKKSLLQSHLSGLRTKRDLSEAIAARLAKFNLPPFELPETVEATKQALRQVQQVIAEIRRESKSVREQSQLDQARLLAFAGRKSDAEILEIIRKKEAQAERWRRISFLQGKKSRNQFSNVEVPASWPTTQAEFLDPDV
eukprot:scaffold5139_cov100-Cylindrotheca_fusiformis.AAC.1